MSTRTRLDGPPAEVEVRPPFAADMTEVFYKPRRESQDDGSGMRPSTAPGNRNSSGRSLQRSRPGSVTSVQSSPRPRPKPHLTRSKSEHAVRTDDQDLDQDNEDIYNWGARHGFEDHYQSEDIISQLASVSVLRVACFNGGFLAKLRCSCFRDGICILPTSVTKPPVTRSHLLTSFKTGACETGLRQFLRRWPFALT